MGAVPWRFAPRRDHATCTGTCPPARRRPCLAAHGLSPPAAPGSPAAAAARAVTAGTGRRPARRYLPSLHFLRPVSSAAAAPEDFLFFFTGIVLPRGGAAPLPGPAAEAPRARFPRPPPPPENGDEETRGDPVPRCSCCSSPAPPGAAAPRSPRADAATAPFPEAGVAPGAGASAGGIGCGGNGENDPDTDGAGQEVEAPPGRGRAGARPREGGAAARVSRPEREQRGAACREGPLCPLELSVRSEINGAVPDLPVLSNQRGHSPHPGRAAGRVPPVLEAGVGLGQPPAERRERWPSPRAAAGRDGRRSVPLETLGRSGRERRAGRGSLRPR